MEFEDFWNPPQPPDDERDNKLYEVDTPQHPPDSPLPSDSAESGSTVQGGSIFAESLEPRNSGGVQGGSTVQGIGSDLGKKINSFSEQPFLEKQSEGTLTSVLVGGQSDCSVDSYSVVQSKTDCVSSLDYTSYPHLTCDNIDAKRNQANEIKRRLLEATTKESLTAVREAYSHRCDWVWKHLLSKAEQSILAAIATTTQLSLLDATASPASSNVEVASLDNPANPVITEPDVSTKPESPIYQKGDHVATPQGEGVVLYFNESWGEYSVSLDNCTEYFKPEDLTLME